MANFSEIYFLLSEIGGAKKYTKPTGFTGQK